MAERGQLAGQVPDVDALAAAVRLAPVGQQRYSQRSLRVSGGSRPPAGWYGAHAGSRLLVRRWRTALARPRDPLGSEHYQGVPFSPWCPGRRPVRKEASLTRRALITGITGQDGSYLAEHLVAQGYEVWGLVRGQANPRLRQLRSLVGELHLVRGDLLDQGSLIAAVERVQPDEVYNLAAISYVPMSWQQAELTGEVTGLGVLRVLEAIRVCSGISASRSPGRGQIRFYQASSSEMFGQVRESPQTEQTPFHPRSPYGVGKAYGHFLTQNYRESYGMFAVSGILFNHESPRRGLEFVTRKVSLGAARIKLGYERQLRLGNLGASRDWGFAGDYVRAMHLMLAADEPGDYVIGTGVTHSVQELVELAFAAAGLDWREHVVTDAAFIRPAEVDRLCADPARARERLGWEPKIGFEELVAMMVEADLELVAASDAHGQDALGPDPW
jgi:GDPmannose 4,6-dehydratase